MPTVGDTRIGVVIGGTQNPVPANGATEVSIDLAGVSCQTRVEEYLDPGGPPAGWFVGAFVNITSIGALSITMSGGISMNTPSGVIDAPAYVFTISSVSGEAFAGSTEYTWNFDNITLTHGTSTFGSVIRSYSTAQVTFTTEAGAPVLVEPADEETGIYLNPLLLMEMIWEDGDETDADPYTVYFSVDGGSVYVPENSRIRYSILSLKMSLGVHLDYETTYYWFVRKDLGGEDFIDSEISSFTTMSYEPPEHSTRERLTYGQPPGGSTEMVPSGENNIITVQRLIAIGWNKFFYEDV